MTTVALQFIELDVDYCSLTYGVSPCTAAVGTTGDAKCFNTLKTCQDAAHFSAGTVTLRFAVPTADLAASGIDCIPSIKSIAFDAPTISLGQNLGQRAALTVTFDDHRHSDTGAGGDKYLADRAYDPYSQGTFFGKFRARQPYLVGKALRWINGRLGQALADMEVRHYIVDSFSGPTPQGEFKIVAKDILKLADGDKSVAPAANSGFLVADITNSATSATLSPSGVGAAEYPTSGYVAIGGSEICGFTRSGDVLTLTRGQLNTAANSHKAQDRVQVVLVYSNADPADIIADLLETYASVPSSYIPLTTWQSETGTYLNRVYSAVIPQPTSVATLISELIEQAGLSIWWNDRDQKIGLMVLRGIVSDAEQLSEQNVLVGSLQISEQPDKRLSQVHTYFGQINPLTTLSEKSNYRSVAVTIDTDAETNYGAPAIKEIFSRWIPALGRTVADRLNGILLGRFADPPRHIKAQLLRYSTSEIVLARGYQMSAWPIQAADGAAVQMPIQVTRLRPLVDIIEIEGDEVLFTAPTEDLSNRQIVVDANINNVNMRTAHDSLYPAPASGDEVTLTVLAGVILGSASPSQPALDIGTWPAGVTLNVVVQGRIEGAGGAGGNAPPPFYNGNPGSPGGTAIYTRQAINVNDAAGEIWGGGGGGGTGGGVGGGGGGGAGQVPGSGGASVNSGAVHPPDGSAGTTEAGGAGAPSQSFEQDGTTITTTAGGAGGGPGVAGSNGANAPSFYTGGAGGAAGKAIDGVSYVTTTSGPGDRRGGQVN